MGSCLALGGTRGRLRGAAARGGGKRRREAASGARAASAEPGPLARGHRAGAAAQDGQAVLLRGTDRKSVV